MRFIGHQHVNVLINTRHTTQHCQYIAAIIVGVTRHIITRVIDVIFHVAAVIFATPPIFIRVNAADITPITSHSLLSALLIC